MNISIFESAIDALNISGIHKEAIKKLNKICLEAEIKYVNDVQADRCVRCANYILTHKNNFNANEIEYAEKVSSARATHLKEETDNKILNIIKSKSPDIVKDFQVWSQQKSAEQTKESSKDLFHRDDNNYGKTIKRMCRFIMTHKNSFSTDIIKTAENMNYGVRSSNVNTDKIQKAIEKYNKDNNMGYSNWVQNGEKDPASPSSNVQQNSENTSQGSAEEKAASASSNTQETTVGTENKETGDGSSTATQSQGSAGEKAATETNTKPVQNKQATRQHSSIVKGLNKDDVKAIQNFLNETENASLKIDGLMGKKTIHALQTAANIIVDNIWGPQTKGAYESMLKSIKSNASSTNNSNESSSNSENAEETTDNTQQKFTEEEISGRKQACVDYLVNLWLNDDNNSGRTEEELRQLAQERVDEWERDNKLEKKFQKVIKKNPKAYYAVSTQKPACVKYLVNKWMTDDNDSGRTEEELTKLAQERVNGLSQEKLDAMYQRATKNTKSSGERLVSASQDKQTRRDDFVDGELRALVYKYQKEEMAKNPKMSEDSAYDKALYRAREDIKTTQVSDSNPSETKPAPQTLDEEHSSGNNKQKTKEKKTEFFSGVAKNAGQDPEYHALVDKYLKEEINAYERRPENKRPRNYEQMAYTRATNRALQEIAKKQNGKPYDKPEVYHG